MSWGSGGGEGGWELGEPKASESPSYNESCNSEGEVEEEGNINTIPLNTLSKCLYSTFRADLDLRSHSLSSEDFDLTTAQYCVDWWNVRSPESS